MVKYEMFIGEDDDPIIFTFEASPGESIQSVIDRGVKFMDQSGYTGSFRIRFTVEN